MNLEQSVYLFPGDGKEKEAKWKGGKQTRHCTHGRNWKAGN